MKVVTHTLVLLDIHFEGDNACSSKSRISASEVFSALIQIFLPNTNAVLTESHTRTTFLCIPSSLEFKKRRIMTRLCRGSILSNTCHWAAFLGNVGTERLFVCFPSSFIVRRLNLKLLSSIITKTVRD